MIRGVIYFNLCVAVVSSYVCSRNSSLQLQRRPIYEFSLGILDRVSQETDAHFVFSPLSTWMHLTTIAEGAQGRTLTEMRKVTGENPKRCFCRKMRLVLNHMSERLKPFSRRCSAIVVDKVFMVKESFKKDVERLKGARVLSLDFRDSHSAAAYTNRYIASCMNDSVTEAIYSSDFNQYAVLIAVDVTYFRSKWKNPFSVAYTKPEPFYSERGLKLGVVNMMNQIAYFNIADVPLVNAKVLELPCGARNEVSMLLFLPKKGSVRDLFFTLRAIRLPTIFNLFNNGRHLVNVKLPKFKITTDMDNLPELLYDMGAKSIFYPHLANLKGISDYRVHESLMSQIADIEVTESIDTARSSTEFLVHDNRTVEFTANRPFVFMVVDRKTDIIIFAGSYNEPELYEHESMKANAK